MTKRRNGGDELRAPRISRREFLKVTAAGLAGLMAGCRPAEQLGDTPTPTLGEQATALPTGMPTAAPTIAPTATPTIAPTATPTIAPAATPTVALPPTSLSQVAIAQADTYERALVRQQVEGLLDGLGGLGDVVDSGDRVAIKVNLTGGTYFQPPAGVSATESYFTHPEVVRALGELLRDAGARELRIVEALFTKDSYAVSGYEEVAEALNATLIDLNDPDPYNDFAIAPVGEGWFIYEGFVFNHILEEVDAFISVGKMKCHFNAGVTSAMKNLIGLVPVEHYRLETDHWWRSALHGASHETQARLARVILDLNRARPIHLALIDGIKTAEGGEVPRGSFNPVEPGVLIASKNAVSADAVATAVMGFDPSIEPPNAPFLRGDNYLNMACELGLGTNRLGEIETVGAGISDVHCEFQPAWTM